MAKLRLPSFEGGSLLQRTLLYVVTFVLGSASFVAIASLLVVWAAKSIVPSHGGGESSASAAVAEKVAEAGSTTTGKSPGKRGRPSKAKQTAEEEAPAAAVDTH